jgi:hypothetical protein
MLRFFDLHKTETDGPGPFRLQRHNKRPSKTIQAIPQLQVPSSNKQVQQTLSRTRRARRGKGVAFCPCPELMANNTTDTFSHAEFFFACITSMYHTASKVRYLCFLVLLQFHITHPHSFALSLFRLCALCLGLATLLFATELHRLTWCSCPIG